MTRQEHWQEIKTRVDIRDYAAYLGFTVIRCGRYYTLKEHDSVRIDPALNCFWQNSRPGHGKAIGEGGSVIDFVMAFTGTDVNGALTKLEKYLAGEQLLPGQTSITKKNILEGLPGRKINGLCLPAKGADMKRVFAYLVKTRKIDASIVQEFAKKRQLYQDERGNCVFVSYENGKPVFACLRGTNTWRSFYGDVTGCDYSKGFFVDYGADKLYITEAVIDTMSVMTLHKEDYQKWNHLALCGGGKYDAMNAHLNGIHEVWIGTDRDETGREAAKRMEDFLKKNRKEIRVVQDFPSKKDWNEVLQERRKGK